MEKYEGKLVVPGVAAGTVFVYSKKKPDIRQQDGQDKAEEMRRFQNARVRAVEQLNLLYEKVSEEIDQDTAAIFEVQAMILEDEDYNDAVIQLIQKQGKRAEYAVALTGDMFSGFFTGMKDEYFRTKSIDIMDVTERLEHILTGKEKQQIPENEPVILAAEDMAPSELIQIEREKLLGLVTRFGSANSHTAMIARVLELPMMIQTKIKKNWHGEEAILDCEEECLYLRPDDEVKEMALKKIRDSQKLIRTMKGKATLTQEGKSVPLYSWIQDKADISRAGRFEGEGVALFRNWYAPFTEACLYEAYKNLMGTRAWRKLIIGEDGGEESKERLKIQMKAALKVSAYGACSLGFYHVATISRLDVVKGLIKETKEELESERIPFKDIPTGILIETAGAGMISDILADNVDFIGVFLKELTENMLAVHLTDQEYPEDTEGFYPSVMRLLMLICGNTKKAGATFILCGKIRRDGTLIRELIKAGIDGICVPDSQILSLRECISML